MLSKIFSLFIRKRIPTGKVKECLEKRKCLEGHRLRKIGIISRQGKEFKVYSCLKCSLRERIAILFTPIKLTEEEKKTIASKVAWILRGKRIGVYEPTMYDSYEVFQQEDDYETEEVYED